MLRLSKLTDYGILLLTYMAQGSDTASRTTRELAAASRLPLPTVEKLLKALSRSKFLTSERGAKGGYRLARTPAEISVADVIESLEGPIAMTECSRSEGTSCDVQNHCPVQSHWRAINVAVRGALADLTLAELIRPAVAAPVSRSNSASSKSRVHA